MKTFKQIISKPGRYIMLPLLMTIAISVGGAAASQAAVIVRARIGPARILVTPRPVPRRVVVVRPARPAHGRYVWVPGHYVKRPYRPVRWVAGHWRRVR